MTISLLDLTSSEICRSRDVISAGGVQLMPIAETWSLASATLVASDMCSPWFVSLPFYNIQLIMYIHCSVLTKHSVADSGLVKGRGQGRAPHGRRHEDRPRCQGGLGVARGSPLPNGEESSKKIIFELKSQIFDLWCILGAFPVQLAGLRAI